MKTAAKKLPALIIIKTVLICLFPAIPLILSCQPQQQETAVEERVQLPEPRFDSDISVEQALLSRRSIRQYSDDPVTLEEVSQLLWAAQGITLPERGYRTSPSAGATFPLYIFLIASNVTGLDEGFYLYYPDGHYLGLISEEDKRAKLAADGIRQGLFREAPCSLVITADFTRTTGRYADRGLRYVHNEVGHVGQNIHLQVETLGLGTVIVGSFNDEAVKRGLEFPDNIDPLYVMPVGRIYDNR